MPCPEKFREALEKFGVDESIAREINAGCENLKSASPQPEKARYFARAARILDEKLASGAAKEIFAWGACCKSGARLKASKQFAKDNGSKPLAEKLELIRGVPNMGAPVLEEDGTITLHAVYFKDGDKFRCACSSIGRNPEAPISKTYCNCCGGHFLFHYQIMLGAKLILADVVSSPIDSEGASPCVFRLKFA